MTPRYANDQPNGFSNRIERVAIVGATGHMGKFVLDDLLKTGKHTITAITRKGYKPQLPAEVKVAEIDYEDEKTIIEALRGQQYLIITLSPLAPPGTEAKLIHAAAKAGVSYVIPNGYGSDVRNESLSNENFAGRSVRASIAEIEGTGKLAWTAVVCSMWYEFSMIMGPEWFGFDLKNKKLTYYDDGNTRINISTWPQVSRAIAALLSLKELPEDENDTAPTVSKWANEPLYISSFLINQRDIFESWKRVTGDKEEDWTIDSQPSAERYAEGLAEFKSGIRRGLAKAMFARNFYPTGDTNYEEKYGLANEALGLPKEDLDESTKAVKKMLDEGWHP